MSNKHRYVIACPISNLRYNATLVDVRMDGKKERNPSNRGPSNILLCMCKRYPHIITKRDNASYVC